MNLFDVISQFPYPKIKKREGRFGIEIETETAAGGDYPAETFSPKNYISHPTTGSPFYYLAKLPEWEGHIDGSLRNFGMEFVSAEPLSLEDQIVALKKWEKCFRGVPFIKNAPATSVHVHVNFQPEELLTLANFIETYLLFENILIEFSGEARRSNLFALPVRVAETIFFNCAKMMRTLASGKQPSFPQQLHKYGALNISSLFYFGSIEIRSFRGTTDIKEIIEWITLLDEMLEFSRKISSPKEIVYLAKNSLYDLFISVFSEKTRGVILERLGKNVDIEALIDQNLFYGGMFSTVLDDWSKIDVHFLGGTPFEPGKEKKFSSLISEELNIPNGLLHTNNDPYVIVDELEAIKITIQPEQTVAGWQFQTQPEMTDDDDYPHDPIDDDPIDDDLDEDI